MRRRFTPGADLPLEGRQLLSADLTPVAALAAPPDAGAATTAAPPPTPTVRPLVEIPIDPAAGPSVNRTYLEPAGGGRSAIVLEFDRPMDRATVENPAAYRVLQQTPPSQARKALGFVFLGMGSGATPARPVKVLEAHYNPEQRAVTLIVPRPQSDSTRLQVRNAPARPRHQSDALAVPQVRDATGRPLHHGTPYAGRFILNVGVNLNPAGPAGRTAGAQG